MKKIWGFSSFPFLTIYDYNYKLKKDNILFGNENIWIYFIFFKLLADHITVKNRAFVSRIIWKQSYPYIIYFIT